MVEIARAQVPAARFEVGDTPSSWDTPVRASSVTAEALAERLRAAGLEIVREEQAQFVPDHSEAGPEPHVYLTACKSS